MSYISEMATFSLTKIEEELKIAILSEVSNGSITFHTVKGETKESTTKVKVSKELAQAFSLRYLNHFNRAATLCSNVHLCFTEESPMSVRFNSKLGVLTFFLAPMILEDIN